MKNKKSLGQHWLKNRAILDEIADLAVPGVDGGASTDGVSSADEALAGGGALSVGAVDAAPAELCIEIGPGLGTLTSSLLKRFAKVIAIEYDHDLAEKLPKSFPGKNLEIVEGDVLDTDIAALAENASSSSSRAIRYSAAGNIPYYITSPIVKKVLALNPRPAKIVLLMQKEVAERIAAEPGDYNLLALEVQNVAEVELGSVVKAAEFTPPPKVDSQILVLTPLPEPQVDATCLELAKYGFSSPRKKLAGNLANSNILGSLVNSSTPGAAHLSRDDWRTLLEQNGINPDARAQDLSLWDWENLYNSIQK